MRANPADYQMVAPTTLQAVVSLLAKEPGAWLPIAGGTDLMVQYAAGKLLARKLVSIWNLPELRGIEVLPHEIRIGAGCTYTHLREHDVLKREFSLLASAASWTGGIVNQNRGTLGGNIVNASPAADSSPALLVYDAELILISVRGERRLPYRDFHADYKKTKLAPDELIRSVCFPAIFRISFLHAQSWGAQRPGDFQSVRGGVGPARGRRYRGCPYRSRKRSAGATSLGRDGTSGEGKAHRAFTPGVGKERSRSGDPAN